MDGKYFHGREESLTDRLFWPVLCACGIALFCFGMLFQALRGTSTPAPAKATNPATEKSTAAGRSATEHTQQLQQPVAPPAVLPEGPTVVQDAVAPAAQKPSATDAPAYEPLDGTYGPRGPPPADGVAENGSYYGQTSTNTGKPKTVSVRGYYRKDGTYVRGHYRSK